MKREVGKGGKREWISREGREEGSRGWRRGREGKNVSLAKVEAEREGS